MEKIYSRKRIKLPLFKIIKTRNRKNRNTKVKILFIFTFVFFAIGSKLIYSYINPMFEILATVKTRSIAVQTVNNKTREMTKGLDYSDLVEVTKDNNGNITMVKANVIDINKISSELASSIQNELKKQSELKLYIPFGSIFGSPILASLGPNIPIKVNPTGTVEAHFQSQFETAGINQTIHRIYVRTKCKVSIVTPLKTLYSEVESELLIGESVIVGPVPSSYYNLEGLKTEDAMEVIE